MKPVLVSGIQPTGKLHIGNYLGALRNFVDLQDSGKYGCYFFIADLHSLTEDFNPKEKHEQILELAADYLAAGLDPKKSVIFLQSQIPAHSELAWILNTITPMGELERMTQFKDKAKNEMLDLEIRQMNDQLAKLSKNHSIVELQTGIAKSLEILYQWLQEYSGTIQAQPTNVGLFDYPVLMAADILLYDPKFVPVGDDQLQHLELTRTLVRKFNAKFGKTFAEPQPLLTKNPRIMSLKDPAKKMSKSVPEGCLFLDDIPEKIKAKIGRAVTDSGTEIRYDLEKKAGLSNLLQIYLALSHKKLQNAEAEFRGKSYADFKAALGDLVAEKLAPFREKKAGLIKNKKAIEEILTQGSARAAEIADEKLAEIKEKIGIAI